MLRRTQGQLFRTTVGLRAWTAEADDVNAPDTTFKNVKPGLALRLWRQIRHRAWMAFVWDEEWIHPNLEPFMHQQRMEQICFAPMSAYGMVPGSYCDPLLYNTKTTSPFRWHVTQNSSDIVGHWYMEADEIFRIKDWQPKNPDDPFEMFPRPPQVTLKWDETVDEHGNRTFRYKYKYDFMGPTGLWEVHPRYPFSHHYGSNYDQRDRMEGYGFKQGELLRCDDEEEEVLRRIMEEEDKEWEMVKRTELVQEPWYHPGKMRPEDFLGAVDRAKSRWREKIAEGKETDPEIDPEYDFVQSGEFVEPQDGPRAEWRHLWKKNLDGKPLPYQVTFNDGITFEANDGKPDSHPFTKYEREPKPAPWKKAGSSHHVESHAAPAAEIPAAPAAETEAKKE